MQEKVHNQKDRQKGLPEITEKQIKINTTKIFVRFSEELILF